MIYFDNNATTKMDSEVLDTMIPYFTSIYGNPSSILNAYGNEASHAVKDAQTILLQFFNADSTNDFIFTSGATESNNMVLQGIANKYRNYSPHIITSCIEHSSIIKTCEILKLRGVTCTYVSVDKEGRVNPVEIENAINERTVLISIMAANNEIGTIQPIEKISDIAHRHNILFHTDVTQYIGTHSIDLQKTKFDMMSLSAHKIHGPKGIGLLYANRNARRKISPLIIGGAQQGGLRGGTLNVPSIVGLGKAIEIVGRDQNKVAAYLSNLQEQMFALLCKDNKAHINGSIKSRIPNNINITFQDVSAVYLMSKLPDLAFSTQSACSSGSMNSSYVLESIGLSKKQIENTIRIGLSKFTTEEEVIIASNQINRVRGVF